MPRFPSAVAVVLEAWIEKTAAYTAVADNRILADTSAGAFTITLPISASQGDQIEITDANGKFGVSNLTVARNGLNIRGLASDLVLDVNWAEIKLAYVDATIGWRY